jgi:tight adherence protein C
MTPSFWSWVAGSAVATAIVVSARPARLPARCADLVARRPGVVPPRRLRGVSAAISGVEALGRWLRRRLGRPADRAADRLLGGAVLAGALGLPAHPLAVLVPVVVPLAVPWITRRRAARRHAEALVVDVPDVVDLFRVATGAGLTVHEAVATIAELADGPLGEALASVRHRVALGERLADALAPMATLGDPVRPLVSALVSTEREGAPLGPPLARVADRARELRRRRAEETARRIPVKLLFPLVLCVLPAFVVLTVVPLLSATLRTLAF